MSKRFFRYVIVPLSKIPFIEWVPSQYARDDTQLIKRKSLGTRST